MNTRQVALGKRNQITLPREFTPKGISLFQCEKQEDGTILLVPQVTVPANQAYFWSKRWQEGEDGASEDIRAGRLRRHGSARELIGRLDRKRGA
ncbi:MAG: AbrB/MazE/SpoVT family DNA-binding domain-containing protein [Nitrospirae bacterium]|nr:AbrB/MazE/SpoVT family DNA-binding domain-containing protein [Nitrospirota bacterium]